MPVITLPNKDQKEFEGQITGMQIAEGISSGLARQSIAVKVNGTVRDMSWAITEDADIELMKANDEDPEALEVMRHSCAHIMAEAITALFPGTKLAYGPPIKDGFFYDMDVPKTLSEEDFEAIEKKMTEIVKENRFFTRTDYNHADGLARVGDDKYKKDNAERAIEKGAESLSFYSTGEKDTAWEDLCSGPHVARTGLLKAFKVMSVSGAYWHGDATSDQLTRVYGTCFSDKKALRAHLNRIEEAKKRDHRKIGKEMNLFSLREDNPGQILWHPRGWTLYNTVVNFVREKLRLSGYDEVNTPIMMPQGLWEKSGHWDKYQENMFTTSEREGEHSRLYALKPMNCPGHTLIYHSLVRSYRDLPLRLAEFGNVIRHEPSGTLHGILRARSFTQDDAHIFCSEEQLTQEVIDCTALVKELYGAFGFDPESVKVKFSTRPEKRIGTDEDWDRAESSLAKACEVANLNTVISPGEGAFYGPKLEFTLIDSLGREWQCGTIQVDYILASKDRLNVDYVAENGEKKTPIIIHRALLGSFERFIGILIENYEGKFPFWLAPEQVRVLQVTDDQNEYATDVYKRLFRAGIHATVDSHQEKLGAKIRRARLDRVPYFLVIGAKEVEEGTVALQKQDGSKLGSMKVDELIERFLEEAKPPIC